MFNHLFPQDLANLLLLRVYQVQPKYEIHHLRKWFRYGLVVMKQQ